MTNGEIITRGTFGASVSLSAAIFSPELESTLRVVSLFVGITVGLLTCWRLIQKRTNEK